MRHLPLAAANVQLGNSTKVGFSQKGCPLLKIFEFCPPDKGDKGGYPASDNKHHTLKASSCQGNLPRFVDFRQHMHCVQ